jgi:HYR domain/Bacterial Ig-like domain
VSSPLPALPVSNRAIGYSLLLVAGVIIIFALSVFMSLSMITNQFAFATLADTSSPVISSFDVNPKVLGPNDVTEHGFPRVIAEAHVSDNVGVTNVAVYAYPKGTTDLVGQALQGISLVEGNAQDGEWRGVYALWPRDAPDGEYEVYVRARDAANNEVTAGPITVTIDRIPPPDPEPPVISSFDVNPKVLGPNDVTEHGFPRVIAEAHVSDNVGVTVVAVYAYPKGTTDIVGGALQQIGLVEGNAQDGEWRGVYALWPRDAPDGEYEVYVEARDAAGNKDTEGPITVTIDRVPQPEDTIPPVISVPEDITEEATGPDGAEVAFEVSAEDDVDGAVDVSCDYNSGDTFPIGETAVTCSAQDAAGNTAKESFTITVQDTTDPDVEITRAVDRSGREIVEGTGSRTPIPYIRITFEATDAVGIDSTECGLDGGAFTSCTSPVVYDRLSRGTHEVIVRATDEAGNTGEDQFTWTVGSPPSNIGGSRNR